MKNKLTNQRIQEIICEAVKIEKKFISECLPSELIGINSALMTQYIECVADRLMVAIGCPKFYNSKNPFDWM